jgi:hypothetical protein
MKFTIIASLAVLAVSAIPNQLTLTPMSTTDAFNAAFAAASAKHQNEKAGKAKIQLFADTNCGGFPVQTVPIDIGKCSPNGPGSSVKFTCSGKDLVFASFYDENCQQTSDQRYFPATLNAACLQRDASSSLKVSWNCYQW